MPILSKLVLLYVSHTWRVVLPLMIDSQCRCAIIRCHMAGEHYRNWSLTVSSEHAPYGGTIQRRCLQKKERIRKRAQLNKNPLKNLGVMLKLIHNTRSTERAAILTQERSKVKSCGQEMKSCGQDEKKSTWEKMEDWWKLMSVLCCSGINNVLKYSAVLLFFLVFFSHWVQKMP